jgi:hypothetical protein
VWLYGLPGNKVARKLAGRIVEGAQDADEGTHVRPVHLSEAERDTLCTAMQPRATEFTEHERLIGLWAAITRDRTLRDTAQRAT